MWCSIFVLLLCVLEKLRLKSLLYSLNCWVVLSFEIFLLDNVSECIVLINILQSILIPLMWALFSL